MRFLAELEVQSAIFDYNPISFASEKSLAT